MPIFQGVFLPQQDLWFPTPNPTPRLLPHLFGRIKFKSVLGFLFFCSFSEIHCEPLSASGTFQAVSMDPHKNLFHTDKSEQFYSRHDVSFFPPLLFFCHRLRKVIKNNLKNFFEIFSSMPLREKYLDVCRFVLSPQRRHVVFSIEMSAIKVNNEHTQSSSENIISLPTHTSKGTKDCVCFSPRDDLLCISSFAVYGVFHGFIQACWKYTLGPLRKPQVQFTVRKTYTCSVAWVWGLCILVMMWIPRLK